MDNRVFLNTQNFIFKDHYLIYYLFLHILYYRLMKMFLIPFTLIPKPRLQHGIWKKKDTQTETPPAGQEPATNCRRACQCSKTDARTHCTNRHWYRIRPKLERRQSDSDRCSIAGSTCGNSWMAYLSECILFLSCLVMHEPAIFPVALHDHKINKSIIFIFIGFSIVV